MYRGYRKTSSGQKHNTGRKWTASTDNCSRPLPVPPSAAIRPLPSHCDANQVPGWRADKEASHFRALCFPNRGELSREGLRADTRTHPIVHPGRSVDWYLGRGVRGRESDRGFYGRNRLGLLRDPDGFLCPSDSFFTPSYSDGVNQ